MYEYNNVLTVIMVIKTAVNNHNPLIEAIN
jgi:hypothetical protein